MDATLTRRIALGALFASGLATPALAQINISKLARLATNATIGEKDEVGIGAKLFGPFTDAMGGSYPNSAIQRAVAAVADPILRTSARPFTWEIAVIDSNEVTAWSLPGGKIGINKGLLRYCANEDELAAVIAHEMGHVELSHAAQEMRAKALGGIALAGATAASSNNRSASATAGVASADLALFAMAASGYSREHERAADAHIATVFAKTGHDVRRGAAFYQTLLDVIPANSKGRTSLFAGHPQTKERLDTILLTAGPSRPEAAAKPAFVAVKTTFPTRKVRLRGAS